MARKPPSVAVFDIGNVLLRWDPRFLYRGLFEDEARMEWFLATVCHPGWNQELDRGGTFAEAVAEAISRHPDMAGEIRAFDERWGEMVPHAIEENVALLRDLRAAGIPVFAITNFSREKFAYARERFPFLEEIEGTVVSAHEGLIKPDPAIYRLFLERYRLAAEACVFIDDSQANVAAAESVGMQAVLYRLGDDLAAALRDLGLRA